MNIKRIVLATGLAIAAMPAFANDSAGFVRVEGGRTDLQVAGEKGDDTGFNVRGGYFFNQHFGVEGFYAQYGKDSAYIDEFEATGRLEASGYGVGVIGKTNFGEAAHTGFFVSGRAGVARNTLEASLSGVGSVKERDTNLYAGVGLGYDFNRNFGLSLNYDYQKPKLFDTRFKVETLTLGLEYRF
jgi:OmpA-OmpF porin, OOP family